MPGKRRPALVSRERFDLPAIRSAPSPRTSRCDSRAPLSRFGGIATIVPASDCVSTFRGEGVEPDLVALAVADHVLTLRGRDGAGLGLRPTGGRRGVSAGSVDPS